MEGRTHAHTDIMKTKPPQTQFVGDNIYKTVAAYGGWDCGEVTDNNHLHSDDFFCSKPLK